ncbi:hypothetical protein [Streptosporangium saharense]
MFAAVDTMGELFDLALFRPITSGSGNWSSRSTSVYRTCSPAWR